MLERADERIFLCDSSKIGLRRTFRLCSREDVSRILCPVPLPWDEN